MIRTYETHISFNHPFVIRGYKDILPAGTYRMEVEEERIEKLSFTSFRRKQVSLYLNANPKRPGVSETLTLAPHEIDAAVAWDRRSDPEIDHSNPKARLFAPSISTAATEDGENKGMHWVRASRNTQEKSKQHAPTFLDDALD